MRVSSAVSSEKPFAGRLEMALLSRLRWVRDVSPVNRLSSKLPRRLKDRSRDNSAVRPENVFAPRPERLLLLMESSSSADRSEKISAGRLLILLSDR